MNFPQLPPFDHQPKAYTGPSMDEVIALRNQFLNPAIFTYYKKPLMIVEGRAQFLFDEKGRRYLDGFGGIVTVSVGHCHPYVVAAANLQNETIQHTTTIYLHPNIAEYARDLAAKMPGDLKVCYFVNSGSEANDLAILMARAFTGNYDLIALRKRCPELTDPWLSPITTAYDEQQHQRTPCARGLVWAKGLAPRMFRSFERNPGHQPTHSGNGLVVVERRVGAELLRGHGDLLRRCIVVVALHPRREPGLFDDVLVELLAVCSSPVCFWACAINSTTFGSATCNVFHSAAGDRLSCVVSQARKLSKEKKVAAYLPPSRSEMNVWPLTGSYVAVTPIAARASVSAACCCG